MSKTIGEAAERSTADWRGPEDPEALAALREAHRLDLPDEDFWVFGYGSLIWRPAFPHREARVARVSGYHRRYCVRSYRHRGSPEVPGLVFGLDRGGSCRGVAYRVARPDGEATMEYLYDREMVTAVYLPRWVTVQTAEGPVRAATFVVDRSHEQYAGRLDHIAMIRYILQGQGINGSARDYLASAVQHLDALGLGDASLARLLRTVDQAQRE